MKTFQSSQLLPLLLVVHFSTRTANAFMALSPFGKPLRPSTMRTRQDSFHTRVFNVAADKPSRVEIEEAAGQLREVKHIPERDAMHGLPSKSPGECTNYACMFQNPELQKKLERITKPRAYPLFLLEKAVKILGDLLPRSKSTGAVLPVNGAVTGVAQKEKLIVLGSGWGSAALLSDIDNDHYDVTVISPRNYFLFTPMLAGAGVGTVDCRSITQPIREFNSKANYLEAAASSIDPKAKTVTCQGIQCDETCEIAEFKVPYDRLVVAVGAKINTFGIPGVEENCSFLKQVDDARQIRRKIINLFETANFPGQSERQLRKLLTFAVIGAGPTGVEFAGELRDFIEQDGPKYYPHLLKYVKIKVIEATPVILRPFDKTLQEAAVEALTRPPAVKDQAILSLFPERLTELVLDKKVEEVTEDVISLSDGTDIPFGLAVWAGGIGPLPITLEIIESLGGLQEKAQSVSRGKIAVDPWLRAVEGEGRIFAIGDCVCTQNNCLPATAQVAAQEGEFLAHLLNVGNLTAVSEEGFLLPPKVDKERATLLDKVTAIAINNNEYVAPFQFLDMGILAYTGSSKALAQVQVTPDEKARVKAKGGIGYGLWRSVYFMKQASMRNRVLVFFDWMKAQMFGRDITAID